MSKISKYVAQNLFPKKEEQCHDKLSPRDYLKKIISDNRALIPVLNSIVDNQPISFNDLLVATQTSNTTLFRYLKELVSYGIIVETTRKVDTASGERDVSFYSTPFKFKLMLMEKQESLMKVDAFDVALLGAVTIVISYIFMNKFEMAIGAIYIMPIIFAYWIYYRILRKGEWRELK